MDHAYTFMSSDGEDAPGKTLDTYSYCAKCGTLKHDYAHGGGLTSPHYPMFACVGFPGWRAVEPECRPAPPNDTIKVDPTACPKCGGSGGGPDPATKCGECDGTGWAPA